jgi:hypothetical protein
MRVILELPDDVVAQLVAIAGARGITGSQVVRRGIEMQAYVEGVEGDERSPGVFLVARFGADPNVVEFP